MNESKEPIEDIVDYVDQYVRMRMIYTGLFMGPIGFFVGILVGYFIF